MKEVYLKITIGIMFVVCAVLIGMTVLINSDAHLTNKKINEIRAQNEDLIKKIQKPSERFYFVTKNQARLLNDEKDQTPDTQVVFEVSRENKDQGLALARQVKEVTPAAVRDIFLAYLADKGESDLYMDKAQHLLKDQYTVILEEMCSHLDMEVSTKLCWDMQKQERICVSTIAVKAKKQDNEKTVRKNNLPVPPPVTFSYRNGNVDPAGYYCQDGIHTVVLGFKPITLNDADRELRRPHSQIPVGGHYTHLIEVHRAKNSDAPYWYLEYEVPQLAEKSEQKSKTQDPEKDAADLHMNAISLLPGNPVVSISSGSIQTFRVPFVNGVSKLLISANKVVFPKSMIATPKNKNGDAFGK